MTAVLPEAEGKRLRARFARWLRSDFGRSLTVTCGWHLVLLVLGNAVDLWFSGLRNPGRGIRYEFSPSWLAHTLRWDGNWYLAVLQGGYADKAGSTAFYPMFPALTWLVHQASLHALTLVAAGFLVNVVASWLAVVAVLKIARCFVAAPRLPWLAVAAVLCGPWAYYLHSFYAEAVFFALGAWAYLFALRRNWVGMGLCLIPLTATRVTAILFVGLCFLEFWRSRGWRWRGLWSVHVVWFPAAALGFYAYAGYLKLVHGDALAMTKAYANWPADVFDPNIPATLWRQFVIIARALGGGLQPGHLVTEQILGLVALAVLLASSGYLLFRLRANGIPLAAFGVASFVMFTVNSNVIAAGRYVLPCVTVYVAVLMWAQRRPKRAATVGGLCAASAVAQAALFVVFTLGYWVA